MRCLTKPLGQWASMKITSSRRVVPVIRIFSRARRGHDPLGITGSHDLRGGTKSRNHEGNTMVMTRSGSQPDKNIRPGQAHPPQGNGQYSQIGSPDAPMSSASDAAAVIYGSPGDATRMSRMTNIAKEAVQTDGTTASYADAFVQGQEFTPTPMKQTDDALVPDVPGFPGAGESSSPFIYLGAPPAAQGKVVPNPVSTKPQPSQSNVSSSPQFTGRY
jgi:hypothetical protein